MITSLWRYDHVLNLRHAHTQSHTHTQSHFKITQDDHEESAVQIRLSAKMKPTSYQTGFHFHTAYWTEWPVSWQSQVWSAHWDPCRSTMDKLSEAKVRLHLLTPCFQDLFASKTGHFIQSIWDPFVKNSSTWLDFASWPRSCSANFSGTSFTKLPCLNKTTM